MHALLLLAVVGASAPIRLAAPTMTATNVDPKTATALSGQLAQQLALQPALRVTTPEEISSLLGLERQKQLLGCADTCTAELAGALGVDAVVLSSVSLLGSSYLFNVKVIGAIDGAQLAVFSRRVVSIEALLDAIAAAAPQLASLISAALRPADAPSAVAVAAPTESGRPLRKAWIPAVIGGVLLLGGGGVYGAARFQEARIRIGDPADVDATISAGKIEEVAGLAMMVTGAAALVASALWAFVFDSSPSVAASFFLTGSSAGFVVQGRWP